MPRAFHAQPAFVSLPSLRSAHLSFVDTIMAAFEEAQLQARVLGPDGYGRRPDLEEIRRAIQFHETPIGWKPFGPADRRFPGAKERIDDDISDFFAPPLSYQMLTAAAEATSSVRSIGIGGRSFAIAVMSLFPKEMWPFEDLFTALRNADREMPFRIAFHWEGGPFTTGIKHVLAGLFSFASPTNKNMFRAMDGIDRVSKRAEHTFVKAKVLACTWREPHESQDVLERRRANLVKAMTAWGDGQVIDVPYDPLRALAETAAGFTLGARVPRATFAPIDDLARVAPFHRQAPIFDRGETVFRSLDGKIMPFESFSPRQNFWLTLIYATPGSGKSVLMNRMNVEFSAYTFGRRLPFLFSIDAGVSSKGFINAIQDALPPERRHEAIYVRLLNDRRYAINPFDLGLGRRIPLERERDFVRRFLLTIIGKTPGDPQYDTYRQLVYRLVGKAYLKRSDLETSSEPTMWHAGRDKYVDDACRKHGIELNQRRTWWWIIDELMERNDVIAAERAQRQAMPLLHDLSQLLAEPGIVKEFEKFPGVIDFARLAVTNAVEAYQMFAHPTNVDLREARVVAIDLNDVMRRDKTPESHQTNSLMFMIARQLFITKIAGHSDEIGDMAFPRARKDRYSDHWRRRYEDMAETPKRLCMDEYHLTGGEENIGHQVLADAREGRKWGLEIMLASQLLSDFGRMKDMASNIFILNAETGEEREEAQRTFGFSDAVKQELARHVHGPRAGHGANFIARVKLAEEERWVLLNNYIGPTLLWALTTKKEDRLVRDALYERLGVKEALEFLALRYPKATALEHWTRVARASMDEEESIAQKIAEQLVGEHLTRESFIHRPREHAAAV